MAGRVALCDLCACGASRKVPPRRLLPVVVRLLLGILFTSALLGSRLAAADPFQGSVNASIQNGFARLVFFLGDDVQSKVHVANNVMVIDFDRPVDISVDRLDQSVEGYISAARRDPDGKAVRIALARKVRVNSMAAGERLFVDLLPEPWTGLQPGLPPDVIEELARRAHDAEKKLRLEPPADRDSKAEVIRVRVASQPTFTRYTFELPDPVGVTAENAKDKLTLSFDAALKFDLADALVGLPRFVASIDSEPDRDSTVVRFGFRGKVDVRTFRDDDNYVVDVSSAELKNTRQQEVRSSDALAAAAAELKARKAAPPAAVETPQSAPARPPTQVESERPPGPAMPAAAAPAPAPPPPASTPANAMLVQPAATVAPSVPVAPPSPAVAVSGSSGPAPANPAPADPASANPAPAVSASPGPAASMDPSADRPQPPGAELKTVASRPVIEVGLKTDGDNLVLRFPFTTPTPAAVFRRADTLWLVFDTDADIKIPAEPEDPTHDIKGASVTWQGGAAVVRIKLERPRLTSVSTEGAAWVVNLGSQLVASSRPLALIRNGAIPSRPSATILMSDPGEVHHLEDPEAGDTLLAVTALGPARGFASAQEFVDFHILSSAHGVVVQPLADDLKLSLAPDRITLSRPSGLSLSVLALNPEHSSFDDPAKIIDPQEWTVDRNNNFGKRESELMFSAAQASETRRLKARIDLARFYLAWKMSAEAKGVLDVAMKDDPPVAADPLPLVLRALSNIMLGHPQDALTDLANPIVGDQYDAPLWRALAYAHLGRWVDAHQGFHGAETQMADLPLPLQQETMGEVVRAAVEVGDVTGAVNGMRQFEALGIPHDLEPMMSVVNGRLAEQLGRVPDALQSYQSASDSWDRPAAAQGQLREIELQQSIGKLQRTDAIAELETLTTIWRGDDTEIEGLKLLAHLYTLEGRYRDSFHVMRAALTAHPSSEMTRAIQDEAAETFENVFLAGRADTLPAIDALALFYDFSELTPIGRRGDEMIRRLSDRLVAVDLLDQAAGMLQYQVDKRLQGAARAQVATRLAVIYLMDRKPIQALATLRATRVENLSNDLRDQRLLIEARALSETGRNDLALEVIADVEGPEAAKLRADILWAAKRWGEAAEQTELIYGDRWKQFAPLDDAERSDILRAAAGYALAGDSLGLMRFRDRYVGKMGTGPDRHIFDVLTQPVDASGSDFRTVAHSVAAVDTLDSFLRDLRARYPETGPLPAKSKPPVAASAATQPPPPLNRTAAR